MVRSSRRRTPFASSKQGAGRKSRNRSTRMTLSRKRASPLYRKRFLSKRAGSSGTLFRVSDGVATETGIRHTRKHSPYVPLQSLQSLKFEGTWITRPLLGENGMYKAIRYRSPSNYEEETEYTKWVSKYLQHFPTIETIPDAKFTLSTGFHRIENDTKTYAKLGWHITYSVKEEKSIYYKRAEALPNGTQVRVTFTPRALICLSTMYGKDDNLALLKTFLDFDTEPNERAKLFRANHIDADKSHVQLIQLALAGDILVRDDDENVIWEKDYEWDDSGHSKKPKFHQPHITVGALHVPIYKVKQWRDDEQIIETIKSSEAAPLIHFEKRGITSTIGEEGNTPTLNGPIPLNTFVKAFETYAKGLQIQLPSSTVKLHAICNAGTPGPENTTAIVDFFRIWQAHSFQCAYGKPIPVDTDSQHITIFFDDNAIGHPFKPSDKLANLETIEPCTQGTTNFRDAETGEFVTLNRVKTNDVAGFEGTSILSKVHGVYVNQDYKCACVSLWGPTEVDDMRHSKNEQDFTNYISFILMKLLGSTDINDAKIVFHFDVNRTIISGDSMLGDNKFEFSKKMERVMTDYPEAKYILRTFGSDLGKEIIADHKQLKVPTNRYFHMNPWIDRIVPYGASPPDSKQFKEIASDPHTSLDRWWIHGTTIKFWPIHDYTYYSKHSTLLYS